MGTEQKVAVITGASQGIGAALVKAYRDRNYRVVATARSVKPSRDDDILVVPGDIADRKTAERAISEGVARFGRIDTLVNNAGIFIAKPFIQYTETDRVLNVASVLRPFSPARYAAARRPRRRRTGGHAVERGRGARGGGARAAVGGGEGHPVAARARADGAPAGRRGGARSKRFL